MKGCLVLFVDQWIKSNTAICYAGVTFLIFVFFLNCILFCPLSLHKKTNLIESITGSWDPNCSFSYCPNGTRQIFTGKVVDLPARTIKPPTLLSPLLSTSDDIQPVVSDHTFIEIHDPSQTFDGRLAEFFFDS